jgi:hypothetical protein
LVQNYTDNIFLLRVVLLTVKDSTTSGLIIAFILERFWADGQNNNSINSSMISFVHINFLLILLIFPFPPFYYHVLLFCKHHLIIPKQYSDWLISIKDWRKIGWSSIPSKLVKVFDQRFLWPLSLSKFHQKLSQSFLWQRKLW